MLLLPGESRLFLSLPRCCFVGCFPARLPSRSRRFLPSLRLRRSLGHRRAPLPTQPCPPACAAAQRTWLTRLQPRCSCPLSGLVWLTGPRRTPPGIRGGPPGALSGPPGHVRLPQPIFVGVRGLGSALLGMLSLFQCSSPLSKAVVFVAASSRVAGQAVPSDVLSYRGLPT